MELQQEKLQKIIDTKKIMTDLDSEIQLLQEELDNVQSIKQKERQKEILLQELDKIKD
jgi:hypothetical protein